MTLLRAPDDLVESRLYPELLTASAGAAMVRRQPATIRSWAHRGHLRAVSHDPRTGAAFYRRRDLWLVEKAARDRDCRRVVHHAA